MVTLFSRTSFFQCEPRAHVNTETEKWPGLALLPITSTLLFYLLPNSLQQQTIIQFIPQLLAYVGFGIWAHANTNLGIRLGIQSNQLWDGLRWGCLVGLALGVCNTAIILKVITAYGGDITFLTRTPHAQVPTLLMVPWTIIAIAIAVEFNFRGFFAWTAHKAHCYPWSNNSFFQGSRNIPKSNLCHYSFCAHLYV